jgi:excisionase family DNA binding protein
MTIDQVAELLAVPKSFIYRRTARGHDDPIPHYRLGGHLRFKAEDIEAWVESHRCRPERKVTAVAAVRAKRSTRSTHRAEQTGLLR